MTEAQRCENAQVLVVHEWRLRTIAFVSMVILSLFVLIGYRLGTFPPIIGMWESYTYYYTVAYKEAYPQQESVRKVVNRIPGYDASGLVRGVADTVGAWVSYRNAMPRQPNSAGGETSDLLYRLARFCFKNIGFNFVGLRIIPAVSLALFVLFFYLFARNLLDDEVAQYATLVLLTFPVLFAFGRQYTIMAPSLLSLSFVSWALTVVEKRPTLIRLILFGVVLSLMPYFYFFSRLVAVAILIYFCIFKTKVPVDGNLFVNRFPIVRLNPQFAVILVVFVGLLALYSPVNILFLVNGEFLFPRRVEYATTLAQMAEGLIANVRFLVLSLTVGPNDAMPIHLMNSTQSVLIMPALVPLFFFGLIAHAKGNLVRNMRQLGDLKYVYLILVIGAFPALLSLGNQTATGAGTSISTSRISYMIMPIAIFVGLGLVRAGGFLRQHMGHERSRIVILAFVVMCSIWGIAGNLKQFDYFDSFLDGKVAGRAVSAEFSPDVKSYTGAPSYHESYSEQVYYRDLARRIAQALMGRGDNVILYVDRERYAPTTTNSHFWCIDYLRPFLSFYLAQEQFDVQYLEWYDGPHAIRPAAIRSLVGYSGCPAPSLIREYEVKSFQRPHERSVFLVTTREDLEVADRLVKTKDVVYFTETPPE